jgi:Na+-transporting methylmalonyl-CoA/oxaloacetate decarboxylase gamma subunit
MKKIFHWVWNINGILFLLLLIIAIISLTSDFIGKYFKGNRSEEEGIPIVASSEKAAKKLKIEIDDDMTQVKDVLIFKVKSNMLIAKGGKGISNMFLDSSGSGSVAGVGGVSDTRFIVNFLFVSTITGKKKFLFDRYVFICDVDYAEFRNPESLSTSPHTYFSKNVFKVISKDSDGNGMLDLDDQNDLYVSDYDGRNLKLIQADIEDYTINDRQKLLVTSENNGKKVIRFYDAEKDQMKLILNSAELDLEHPAAID